MPVVKTEYEVIDERIQPDLRGELGGARIYIRAGKRYVQMSVAQAKYYLENRAIKKVA